MALVTHLPRIFGAVVYFLFSTLSYLFIFDHATFKHPKYLKNQVRLEIRQTLTSLPLMAVLTTPFFLAEVRGHTKLYNLTSEAPFALYNLLQFPFFIIFTDFFIYFIHRGLHHRSLYKSLHKSHHKWIMPTPFASHAFNPLDVRFSTLLWRGRTVLIECLMYRVSNFPILGHSCRLGLGVEIIARLLTLPPLYVLCGPQEPC